MGKSNCIRDLLLKGCLLLSPLTPLSAEAPQAALEDQLLVIFGSSGYILYKVLDFANDHGFRYLKILSYQFEAFEHSIHGVCHSHPHQGGRYFELKDDHSSISFLCFDSHLDDPTIIDLEKYRRLLVIPEGPPTQFEGG